MKVYVVYDIGPDGRLNSICGVRSTFEEAQELASSVFRPYQGSGGGFYRGDFDDYEMEVQDEEE